MAKHKVHTLRFHLIHKRLREALPEYNVSERAMKDHIYLHETALYEKARGRG